MWGRIKLNEVSLCSLETRISRAKATDISLYVNDWTTTDRWDVIRAHLGRISRITVDGDIAFEQSAALLPRLEYSVMELDVDKEDVPVLTLKHFSLLATSPTDASPSFFPSTKLLQTLELRNADLIYDDVWEHGLEFPEFPSLKTLKIHHVDNQMGVSQLGEDGLLDMLSRVPLIEVVELVWDLDPRRENEKEDSTWHRATVGDTLLLPHLKELTLHLYTPDIASLLLSLRSGAPLEKLDVRCLPYPMSDGYGQRMKDSDDFIEAMPNIASSASLPVASLPLLSASFFSHSDDLLDSDDPYHLAMDPPGNLLLSMRFWNTTADSLPSDFEPDYPISIFLNTPDVYFAGEDRGTSIVSAFSKQLQTVTSITVDTSWQTQRYWEALAHFPCISSIRILSSHSFNGFLDLLSQANGKSEDFHSPSSSESAPYLALERISVVGILFGKGDYGIQRLIKVLGDRSRGEKVKALSVHFEDTRGLLRSEVNALSAVVAKVTVTFPSIEPAGEVSAAMGGYAPEDYHTGPQCESGIQ